MDYLRLNRTTKKDYFRLRFIGQMLDNVASKEYYCFMDCYSRYNQIIIEQYDQEKIVFTCSYGTFAFKRMSFGLCTAPAIFHHCMMTIFGDMVEQTLEIFIFAVIVFGEPF